MEPDWKSLFFKKGEELRAAEQKNRSLEKKIDKLNQKIASTDQFKEYLSHEQGFKNTIAHLERLVDAKEKANARLKSDLHKAEMKNFELIEENNALQWQIDCLTGKKSLAGITAKEKADKTIQALTDEVARLNALRNTDGTNAGIPTSKTPLNKKKVIPNSRVKTGKHIGGQPGHERHEMLPFNDDEITETIDHTLEACPNCGSNNLDKCSVAIKDELDYEVKVVKRRHRFLEYTCPDCGSTVRAPYNGLVAKNQYGKNIQGMALTLMNTGFVSVGRTNTILSGLLMDQSTISDGYIIKLQKRHSKLLEAFVESVKDHLLTEPLLYWDDTVISVNTKRACFRFYGTGKIALFTAHSQKNLEGIYKDNILPMLSEGTTVMHDHNSINYHSGFVFRNVECNQHLERKLQSIADQSSHEWPTKLKNLISTTIHRRKELIKDGVDSFSKEEIVSLLYDIDAILEDAWNEYSININRYYSNDERALIECITDYKDNYFEWIRDFNIPTTNNLSEQSLRFTKLKDKVSGQFQSIEYASYFANIRSYLETCSRNGVSTSTAIDRLTSGNPYTLDELLGEA